MSIYLHHYPASLFSEKIRVLLGYLELPWHSVEIAPIMPRPLLMPLSAGYRRTPIMNIGANVYCDTQVIARALAWKANDETLYATGLVADQFARWADTELFRIVVALNFRPEALAAQMSQMSAEDMQAFAEDRAKLSGGADLVQLAPAAAHAHFIEYLQSLGNSLTTDFLFGSKPSIADFSLYHCLWFVAGNPVNSSLFEQFPDVRRYMQRMQDFGHGAEQASSSEAALAAARDAEIDLPDDCRVDAALAGAVAAGSEVTVAATDYGRDPLRGSLVKWTREEIVIERQDQAAGRLLLHVPNTGFAVEQN